MIQKTQGLIDVQVRHAWHRIYRMYNQKAMAQGLTISAGFILMNIDRTGTPSTSLGPRMGMEPTSLSRTLKSLEDQGWIRREITSLDKRKVLIFLTTEGLKKRNIVRDFLVDFNEKITKRITQKELHGFFKTMQMMDEIIDEVIKTN